jgi:CelD/BcsL family acetyltransferase involved in cellulose biosynthesis
VQTAVHHELGPLLAEWGELFAADPSAAPFSSPQWAEAWWPHWAGPAEPWLVAVRDRGRLVGLAALLRRRQGPFSVLSGIGRGPGDYWDVLAAPGLRDDVAAEIAAEIARRRADWDALILDGLRSPALPAALAEAGLRIADRPPLISVDMALPPTFDEYLAGMPGRRRSNLRKHLRRLDEGEFAFSTVEGPGLAGAVDRWHEMRARWWRERGLELAPMHGTERFRAFTADAVAALVPAGLAEVWELSREGEPVGVCINLIDPRAFYVYLAAFDPGIAKLGPGKIQVGHAIRSSIAAGRTLFDFTIGRDDYKYWFGATDVERPRQAIGSNRLRSRAAGAVGALRERQRGAEAE